MVVEEEEEVEGEEPHRHHRGVPPAHGAPHPQGAARSQLVPETRPGRTRAQVSLSTPTFLPASSAG